MSLWIQSLYINDRRCEPRYQLPHPFQISIITDDNQDISANVENISIDGMCIKPHKALSSKIKKILVFDNLISHNALRLDVVQKYENVSNDLIGIEIQKQRNKPDFDKFVGVMVVMNNALRLY